MPATTHPERQPERLRATLIGFIAVLLWATLALFTTATGQVPPFMLLSLTFGIAFLAGVAAGRFTRLCPTFPVILL